MAIDINGDGLIQLGGTSTTQGRVRLNEDTDNGTNYIELTAPASVTSNKTITLPDETGTVITTATTTGINASAISTGTLAVANGGTGANTLTAEAVIIGNTTGAVKFVAAGTSGNVLTSNGTAWVSQAAASGGGKVTTFSSPGTWTKPTGLTAIRVSVLGAGGGGSGSRGAPTPAGSVWNVGPGGGGGGYSTVYLSAPEIPGPVSVTIGTGGSAGPAPVTNNTVTAGGTGGTSSFGSFVSATGGTGGTTSVAGPGGIGGAASYPASYYAGGDAGTPATAGAQLGAPATDSTINYGLGGVCQKGINASVNTPQGPTFPPPTGPGRAGVAGVYGNGGTGGIAYTSTGQAGGAGSNGFVVIEEFY